MESNKQKIIHWIYRQEFHAATLVFDEVLLAAAKDALDMSPMNAEAFVAGNVRRYWNWLLGQIDFDVSRGLHPIFVIEDEVSRRLRWSAVSFERIANKRSRHKAIALQSRPKLLQTVDALNDRQYEAIACVISHLMGADRVHLTPPGDEGGIDFFALIPIQGNTHVFSGMGCPLRIVGQCKKYQTKLGVEKIREFITSLNDVRHRSPTVGNHVPAWFRAGRGAIVGWMISHSGYQTGAEEIARSHGIVLSDSFDLVEILALSRQLGDPLIPRQRIDLLRQRIASELDKEQVLLSYPLTYSKSSA